MMRLTRTSSITFFAALSCFVVLFQVWLVNSARFKQYPELFSFSITVDIAIFIPLLYYFFVIRKKMAPPITLAFLFILSLAVTHLILPSSQRLYLSYLKMVLPVIELVVLIMIFRRARKVIKDYRQSRQHFIYFTDTFEEVIKKVLGNSPVTSLAVTEMAIIYYSIAGWFKKFKCAQRDAVIFSYHKKSGIMALSGVLFFITIVETAVMHVFVRAFSIVLAWLLTGLGIYFLFWFLGFLHSIRLQPIVLHQGKLYIRAGMIWRVAIPLSDIAEIRPVTLFERKKTGELRVSVFITPNFAIHMKDPVNVKGIFRVKRNIQRIGIFIDDAQLFREEMSSAGFL